MPVRKDNIKPEPAQVKPERPTLAGQLARQHELLMAQATKAVRAVDQTVEFAERHAGAKDGLLRVASVKLVQHEDEEDVQFLGRIESFTRDVFAVRDRLNAEIDTEKVGATKAGE